MEDLIESLQLLYLKLSEKADLSSKETQTQFEEKRQMSLICIFPKKILRKTFLFLDFVEDVPEISLSCKLFNSVIKSRTFQVLLQSQVLTKASKAFSAPSLTNPNEFELAKLKPENEIVSKEDALSQLKLAYNGRDFLANKLKKQDRKIEELNKEIGRLQEEIKMQKNIDAKGIEKMNVYEKMLENETKNHAEAQKSLGNTQAQYKSEIENLRAQICVSEKDRSDLQKQKKAVKEEVLEYRSKNSEIAKKIAVYQDVLNKMKAYFEAMQEAKLLES